AAPRRGHLPDSRRSSARLRRPTYIPACIRALEHRDSPTWAWVVRTGQKREVSGRALRAMLRLASKGWRVDDTAARMGAPGITDHGLVATQERCTRATRTGRQGLGAARALDQMRLLWRNYLH